MDCCQNSSDHSAYFGLVYSERSAARLLVECLENEGVEPVFGIPGEENVRFEGQPFKVHKGGYVAMSRLILERELHLIRERLEAIEDALGEEMTADDKESLEEALKEHRQGKTIPFKSSRSRTRKR